MAAPHFLFVSPTGGAVSRVSDDEVGQVSGGITSVVAGAIRGQTMTLPLQIELMYNDYNATGAFAAATVLTALALVTLVLRGVLNRFGPKREAHA